MIAILGSKASQFMNILTLNKNNPEHVLQLKLSNVIDDYPDVFKDELGQLPGEAHFITDPSVTPVVFIHPIWVLKVVCIELVRLSIGLI